MSNTTQFSFYVEKGFKGNLARAPELCETQDGDEYASIVVYVTPNQYDEKKINNDDELALIAYLRIYDDKVREAALKELDKGDFVNFTGFSSLRVSKSIDVNDDDVEEEKTVVNINVEDYEVYHKKSDKSKQSRKTSAKKSSTKGTSRRRK